MLKNPEKTYENESGEYGRTTQRTLSLQHSTDSPQRQEDMTSHPNTIPPPTPPTVPMSSIKIATININGIIGRTRAVMLADFIRQHDFDILFAQEVTSTEVLNVRGYNTHLNIVTSTTGTTILARSTLNLTNITTLPS
jgi:hypothetical protein